MFLLDSSQVKGASSCKFKRDLHNFASFRWSSLGIFQKEFEIAGMPGEGGAG